MIRRAVLLFVALSLVLWTRAAEAYPWFIRDGYTHCAQCHTDPSGSGLLTDYGRAQGELLLRTRYGFDKDDEEPGKLAQFLWGVPLPDGLLLGGSIRNGLLTYRIPSEGGAPKITDTRALWMQEDLHAQVQIGRVRLSGSLGFLPDPEYAGPAQITTWKKDNLVSRDFWVGVDLGEDKDTLVRVGRLNLPYGLRSNEHTLFIHTALRDDTNTDQQYGAAVAFNRGPIRAEIMAYIGNLQVSPPTDSEHGISAYFEYAFAEKFALGVSGLAAESSVDVTSQAPLVRQGYGPFFRWSPARPFVLMGEADGLIESVNGAPSKLGYATMLQADVMPMQGVHIIATGEAQNDPTMAPVGSVSGAWLGVDWFFLPHADIRVDGILHVSDQPSQSLLAQFHVYL